MPTIPLLPSDSSAVVGYKIFLDTEVGSVVTTAQTVQKWRRYYDGLHDLLLTADQSAFLGKIISAAGTEGVRKLNGATIESADWPIDNKVRKVVDRINSRLNVIGLTDQTASEVLFADATPGTDALSSGLRWWKTSDLDTNEDPHYRNVLRDDEGYVIVDHDGTQPRFSVHERYDGTSGIRAHWEDDARTKLLYATKYWYTLDPTGDTAASNVERCTVYTAVEVRKYIRITSERQMRAFAERIIGKAEDGWYPIIDAVGEPWPIPWVTRQGAPLGVAVIPFVSPRGSLIQAAIGLQNALNKTNLDRLAAADQLGFGMIVAKYDGPPPTRTDSSGREIDPAGNGLGFRPGVVLETTADVSKLPADDLKPLADTAAAWAEAIASNTDVPMHEVSPLSGQVPSGAALRMLESGLTSLVEKCQSRFGSAWRQAFDLAQALAVEFGGMQGTPTTIYPVWKSPTVVDPTEESAARQQKATEYKTLVDAGMPKGFAAKEVYGWDDDKIALMMGAAKEEADAAQASVADALMANARALEQQQPSGTVDVQGTNGQAQMMGNLGGAD